MLYTIVATMCMTAAPGRCIDVVLLQKPIAPTIYECVEQSQFAAVKWLQTHPFYKIKEIRCGRRRMTT